MKVILMYSLAFLTLEILKAIYTQNLMVGQELIPFKVKKILSSDSQLFLQPDQSWHVFMILSQVV